GAGGSGASGSGSGASSGTNTSTSGMGGDLGLGGSFAAGTGGSTGSSMSDCSAASQLVYVFSLGNEIYSFDPPSKVFTPVATPDCQAGGSPNSMAIDRNLVAWLNYIGGIYRFDLNKKSGCKLAITLPPGFTQVGMGFSSDSPGSTAETLYID